jgi:hypothetical protein
MSKRDLFWTRLRLEKAALAQHEIIDVAVVVLGWKLTREIACPFNVRAKTKLWVGHFGVKTISRLAPATQPTLQAIVSQDL